MTAPASDAQAAQQLVRRIQRDPVWFAREILGFEAWSKQRLILESVRDNDATAVRSCHGIGKTATAAEVVLWFLAAFGPECLVVTTAPTWRQVKDLLWREIRKAYKRGEGFYQGHLTETRLDFAPDWYAVGLSTNQPENFQGYHAPHLLFVVDEASGVRQAIFEAAEGFLTAAGSRTLLIGNPTQIGGEFHSAFHGSRSLYNAIHVSAFDTPAFTGEAVSDKVARVLPSKQWVERMKTKYRVADKDERGGSGVRLNPVYEVRVLGQFPSQGERAVVPMYEVENAQARELPMPEPTEAGAVMSDELRELLESSWPAVVSCDVARFGDDETVIALRQGKRVRIVEVIQGQDTMETAGMLLRYARANVHPLYGKPLIAVDDTGVGGGVTDRLRELSREDGNSFRVIAFNGSNSPAESNADEYPNARSELWFEFAEDWLPELDLDDDEDLLADLCAPQYNVDSKSRRVVEPKDETKKRLGRSPDRADAVMIAFSRGVNAGLFVRTPSGPTVPGGSRWQGMGGGGGGSKWQR
jgi:phage terminase large subunit